VNAAPALKLLLAAIASLPLACKDGGCGGSGSGAAPSASVSASAAPSGSALLGSASASASVPATPPLFRGLRLTGASAGLFRAASTLDLKDEQKATLEKLSSDMRDADKAAREGGADGGPPRNEIKEAHAELAFGVKAGKIDNAKMEVHYSAIEKAAKARLDREADALNRLYAALEPAQRSTVAGTVRTNEEKRLARLRAHERPDAGRPNFAKMQVERWTRDLDLDAAQQKKVEAIVPKEDKSAAARDEMKKQVDTLLAAFEKEGFDAKKLEPNGPKKARAPLEEQAKFYGQLLPILKPEQREKLAKRMGRGGEGGHFRPSHRGLGMGERSHDFEEDEDSP
jgi:Spy/CpxP family protein refolding chaperone